MSIIKSCLQQILIDRIDVIKLVCRQRAKFEHWLKIELAIRFFHQSQFSEIIIEDSYAKGGRSDLSFIFDAKKWQLEMKTANTNWRARGLESITRPITMNIDGIIDDINILREKGAPAEGIMLFSIFPVPKRIWVIERDKLKYHFQKIERECELPLEFLFNNCDFVEVDPEFGVSSCVFEA